MSRREDHTAVTVLRRMNRVVGKILDNTTTDADIDSMPYEETLINIFSNRGKLYAAKMMQYEMNNIVDEMGLQDEL